MAEPCTLGDEALQPVRPIGFEPVDVIGAHLIDRDEHDQRRRVRRGGACLCLRAAPGLEKRADRRRVDGGGAQQRGTLPHQFAFAFLISAPSLS